MWSPALRLGHDSVAGSDVQGAVVVDGGSNLVIAVLDDHPAVLQLRVFRGLRAAYEEVVVLDADVPDALVGCRELVVIGHALRGSLARTQHLALPVPARRRPAGIEMSVIERPTPLAPPPPFPSNRWPSGPSSDAGPQYAATCPEVSLLSSPPVEYGEVRARPSGRGSVHHRWGRLRPNLRAAIEAL